MNSGTSKLVIAVEYLETAAILWMYETNLFSAMHLAAAAEEISGKACRIEQKKAYFDKLREKVTRTLLALRIEHTESQIKNAAYSAKNSIKHMDSRNDAQVKIDARQEAADFIFSAYCNFRTLGLETSLSSTVKAVVEANSVYVETDT